MDNNEILETKNESIVVVTEKKMWDFKVVSSFIVGLVFIGIGFDKLFNYHNDTTITNFNHNAYVGGDAYNYIINAGQSTAYFVLALIFTVLGCTFLICNHLNNRK